MKKILMSAAVATMLLTVGTTKAQSVQTENKSLQVETAVQDGFKEIKTSQLPEAVTAAVKKDFEDASIYKAYVNKQKEYKLLLKMEDVLEPKTVYANAKGEWIKK